MPKPTSVLAATLATAATLVVLATAASAAPTSQRPSGGTYGRCIDDSVDGGSEHECEGAICSCCYSDGCFICENSDAPTEQSNCHWEPPYRVEARDGMIVQPGDLLDIGPAAPPSSQRPTVTQPGGALSQ